MHTVTTITAHETTNDSYESLQSGSYRAAIMQKNGPAVISNYSKLQNIENASQEFTADANKTRFIVFLLFLHSNRLHSCNHYRNVEENSVKYVPPGGFFGIQIFPI